MSMFLCSRQGLVLLLLAVAMSACGKREDANVPAAGSRTAASDPKGGGDRGAGQAKSNESGKNVALASLAPDHRSTAEKATRTALKRNRRPATASDPQGVSDFHGRGLSFITKDAWFAIDVPSVPHLVESFATSELHSALERSGLLGNLASLDAVKALAYDKFNITVPEVRHIVDEIVGAKGEMVLSLLDLDPSRLERGDEMPFTAALFVELGDRASKVAEELSALQDDPTLRSERSGFFQSMARVSDDLYLISDATLRVELMVKDSWVAMLIGPPAKYAPVLDDLAILPRKDSFLASALLTHAPRPIGEGASPNPVLECYLNFASVPQILDAYAGRQARDVAMMLGVDQIAGLSMMTAFDHGRFSEAFGLVSPDRKDVFTSLFDSKALDPTFARYALPGAEESSVLSFDFSRALTSVRERLPDAGRAAFDSGIDELNRTIGMDVRRELLAMLGANFTWSSKGDLASAFHVTGGDGGDGAKPFELALAVELSKADLAKRFVAKLVAQKALPAKARKAGDHEAFVVESSQLGVPASVEVSFAITDDALVIASSFEALTRILEAADSFDDSTHTSLMSAIAASPSEAFAISTASTAAEVRAFAGSLRAGLGEIFASDPSILSMLPTSDAISKFADGLADSRRFCSATKDGIVVDTESPIGNPSLLALPIGIAASVALPKLMDTRIQDRQSAVMAQMRMLAAAEMEFRGSAHIDSDHDGIGEFATLAELCGRVALPGGSKLDPPLIEPPFGEVVDGHADVLGYRFAVFLPGANGKPVAEVPTGGRAKGVDGDLSERQFAIYAWPIAPETSGSEAYFVDSTGVLHRAAPNSGKNSYANDLAPEGDAAFGLRGSMMKAASIDKGTGFKKGASGMLWAEVR